MNFVFLVLTVRNNLVSGGIKCELRQTEKVADSLTTAANVYIKEFVYISFQSFLRNGRRQSFVASSS
jgi:hypothetical protein